MRAFDVRTGKRLWTFHTVPQKGEFGWDTWANGTEKIGHVGVWTQMAIDEELGMVYLPVETPTNDYYGANRPGNNLFAESLVALDLREDGSFTYVPDPGPSRSDNFVYAACDSGGCTPSSVDLSVYSDEG